MPKGKFPSPFSLKHFLLTYIILGWWVSAYTSLYYPSIGWALSSSLFLREQWDADRTGVSSQSPSSGSTTRSLSPQPRHFHNLVGYGEAQCQYERGDDWSYFDACGGHVCLYRIWQINHISEKCINLDVIKKSYLCCLLSDDEHRGKLVVYCHQRTNQVFFIAVDEQARHPGAHQPAYTDST